MTIEQEPFKRYKEDGEDRPDTFTVRLNAQERAALDEAKRVIMQEKDSTAIKQLAEIGIRKVLHDAETRFIIEALFKNKRLNLISGVPSQEPRFPDL